MFKNKYEADNSRFSEVLTQVFIIFEQENWKNFNKNFGVSEKSITFAPANEKWGRLAQLV